MTKGWIFSENSSRVARDGSNLAKGLGLAAAMLPEGNQGRVVLISDGNETDGSAAAQLDEFKARGIPVDVLPISYGYEKEVWLERLDQQLPLRLLRSRWWALNFAMTLISGRRSCYRARRSISAC